MKTISRYIMTLALLIMAVGGAWADGIVCTASDLGKVLCTDGSIYENVSAATTAGKTAVAMIAYVDETNKNGLAIALADESGTKDYEAAGTACSGKAAVTGGTWRLPSDKDWQYMFIGCGSSESYSPPTHAMSKSYSGLASKLTTAQGADLQSDFYWSSTKDEPNGAWGVVFNGSNATFYMEDKTVEHQVRACLAFDIAEPTEWSLTPDADKKVWTLDKMPANNIELQVEYEPTKVTMAVNDKTMGTAEVAGESKVEWTADTWKGWTADTKTYTVDDITMTSSESGHIREYTSEDKYNNSLFFFVRKMVDDATVTFSTTGDPFSRIEFTMIGDYSQYNPDIIPNDNWTFEGKSAVWEGEATKSLTLQSCSTNVSKITFYKGAAIPDGVTVNTDGTFTVAKTATVTLKATPAEGYKFLYWEDDQTNTNPVREVTIESGMADMTYKAVFAEITYNVTFAEGTDPNEWTADPNADVKKGQTVTVTYTGSKKVIGVKAEKKSAAAAPRPLAEAVAADLGKIAGADGNIYDTKAAAEAVATGNAVAMIAYVGSASDCTHGLAIALADESGTKTWSEAGAACSGKTAVTGGTWRLPSIKGWQYMFIGCGASGSYSDSPSTMSYSELATKLTTANGTALQTLSYWSSTESSPGEDAWSLYFGGSSASFFSGDYEGGAYPIRACLAF